MSQLINELEQLTTPWTFFETCYYSICPHSKATTPEKIAGIIRTNPEAAWIAASDSGQTVNPPSPNCLTRFASELLENGLSRPALERMLKTNPKRLLAI